MIKIGVLGTGHLGKIHLKCLQLLPDIYHLVGFHDPDAATRQQVTDQFSIPGFDTVDELIDQVEVVDIVSPTTTHFELASRAIRKGRHVFVEKPLTHTIAEAEALVKLKTEFGVQVQVGHVERFNPALLAIGDLSLDPMFIEGHRLATFNPRGTDVSVVLDLMIHDLDIILSLISAPVSRVLASGVAVVSDTPDIANARIEFANGCVANLTASRISIKQMRKIRLFQRDAYIGLDFLDKQAQVIRLLDSDRSGLAAEHLGVKFMDLETSQGKKAIHIAMPEIEPVNAIKMELETFAQSIQLQTSPRVSIEDGFRALSLAYQIIGEIESRGQHL